MPWQFSVLFYVFLSSSRAIVNRRIGLLKQDVSLYALSASFICVASVGVVSSLLLPGNINHTAAREAWIFIVGGGSLFAVLNLLVLKLFRYVPASIAVFMSLLNTLSVIIFAYVLTSESLTGVQWLGAGVLLTAVILIALIAQKRKGVKKHQNMLLGTGLAVAAALLFGPAIVNENYLIGRIGIETYLLYGWGLQAIMSLLLAFTLRDKSKSTRKLPAKVHKLVWLYGGLLGAAGFFFVQSLNDSGNSSVTSISATARVAVVVVFSYVLLGEKDNLKLKLLGLVITGIGLTLLFA